MDLTHRPRLSDWTEPHPRSIMTLARPDLSRRRPLRCLAAGALLLALTTAPARAQEEAPPPEPALQAGAWALQFGIGGNLDLTAFLGSTVSAKYHLRDDRALRFGVRLQSRGDFTEDTETRTDLRTSPTDTTQFSSLTRTDEYNSSLHGIGLDAQYLFYSNLDRPVKLFWGVGPRLNVQWSGNERDRTTVWTDSDARTEWSNDESDQIDWQAGAAGVIGGEWFVAPQISLTAEYGLSAVFWYRTNEQEGIQRSTSGDQVPLDQISHPYRAEHTTWGWSLAPDAVRFGLTLYL